MGRKQPPKHNVGRYSQTSIEKSIQNMKDLSRTQMERKLKLIPDVSINISDDAECTEHFRSKSHSELGIKKNRIRLFALDSDEDTDNKFSDSNLNLQVTPAKPRLSIGVNRPVAYSTPLVLTTNPDISSNLQQSPIEKDTSDTTIRNTSNVHENTTIKVLENIILTSSNAHNNENETRGISMQTVFTVNGERNSAENVVLPLTSPQKASDAIKKKNDRKKETAVENKSFTKTPQIGVENESFSLNIPVVVSQVNKKGASRMKRNGVEINDGSPRKISKIGQTSDTNQSINVAHLANCVYETGATSTDPKNDCSGSNLPSAIGVQDCSSSKKITTEDKDEQDLQMKTKCSSILEDDIIKFRNQLISIGQLPTNCTTTSLKEIQALLNQDIANDTSSLSHSVISGFIGILASATEKSQSTDVDRSSVNPVQILQGTAQGDGSSDVQVAKTSSIDPSVDQPSSSPSLRILTQKVCIVSSELNFENSLQKQTDPGTSSTNNQRDSRTAARNTRVCDQSTTEVSIATDVSASKSSISNRSTTSTTSNLENIPRKTILPYDEAQRLMLQNCGSSDTHLKSTSTLLTTPTKTKTVISNNSEKTPTKSSDKNFVKTPTKRSLFRGSPRKIKMSPKSPTKQSKSANSRHLELIKEKIFNVLRKSLFAKDIIKNELDVMEQFFKLDVKYQYVCLKLLTYKWKWYNVHKFCKKIEIDMDDNEIATMYDYLKNNCYVDTDYEKSEDISHLLHTLDCTDIRGICDTFKLNSKVKKKEEMIILLLKYCKTQCTLTTGKSSRDLLLEKIRDKMGASMKVKDKLRNVFYRLYTMATFSNIAFTNISDFFNNMLHIGIVFPEYDVEEALVFWNRSEFLSYVDAFEEYKVLEQYCISKRHVDVLARCRDIFEIIKKLPHDDDAQRYQETPHLKRYSAKSVYISCLTKGCNFLRPKFPEDVRVWLEYLIENFTTSHRLGKWYSELCCIYMSKEKNYKKATNLILQAFTQHETYLNDIQKFLLSERAELLKCSKKYKIDQLDHDKLAKVVPVPKYEFIEEKIDAKTIRGNESGRKRHYVVHDADGSSSYVSVETIALQHYIDVCGYTDGGHFEGAIVKSLFNLLFWDIMYNPKQLVPATFISKLQEVPLDMYTTYFYQNRKDGIDKRIEEIRSVWTDAHLLAFARNKHSEHSHENSMCQIQSHIKEPDLLDVLIPCIGRQVLADIFKRLVKDIRQYRSGLPDLMVWNAKEQKCKFVEVKGENDRLSAGQNLWINYLMSIGANVQVCVVHCKCKNLK